MKNIIFVEKKSHIDKALSLADNHPDNLIISLFPAVSVELEEKKVPFKTPEAFFRPDRLNDMGMDNYSRTDGFCKYLDEVMKSKISIFSYENINAASMHYYYYKILFDSVLSKYFMLEQIINAENPENLFYITSQKEIIERTLFFNRSSIYSRIIPLISKKYNLKYTPYGDEAEFYHMEKRNNIRLVTELIRYSPGTLVEHIKTFTINNLLSIKLNIEYKKNRNSIFILASGHDIPHIIEEIKKAKSWNILQLYYDEIKNPSPIFPYEKTLSFETDTEIMSALMNSVEGIWDELLNDKIFHEFFVFEGCDMFPVFEDRLGFFIKKGIVEILDVYLRHKKAFEFYESGLTLTSTTNLGYIGQSIIHAAKKAGIPTVTYQEGAGYGSPEAPMYEHTEYLTCDYFLSYGEGTEDHLKKTGAQYSSKIIPTGSVRLDKIMQKSQKKKRNAIKNIMYIPSYVQNNIQHFPYNAGTANYNFDVQRNIIDFLKEYDEYTIFVKCAWYGHKELAQYIKTQKYRNIKLIESIPLEYVLHCADMYILDFPSTVHLECLVTGKPVFIYLDNFMTRMNPESRELLDKRAFCCLSLEDLEAELSGALVSGHVSEKNDDLYIKQFCTHINDGKSLERVKYFIETLNTQNSKKL